MRSCGKKRWNASHHRIIAAMPPVPDDKKPAESPRGPRGGRTTVSSDGTLIRKTFYIDRDVEDALREECFRTRRTEAEIVREALRDRYGIE